MLYVKKLSELDGRFFKTKLEMKTMFVFYIYNPMIKKCTWKGLKLTKKNKVVKTVFFFYDFLLETVIKG